ncbi:MAG: DUF4476 domain-containing protein [Myxococcota bacterium]
MFPLLLATFANAAEIQVISNDPVTVEVDGRVVANRPGERGATALNLAGGNHRVQIFDAQDRLVTASTVLVTVDEQVRLELRRGQLAELGRGPLAGSSAPAVCPPAAPAPEPGSFQLTGVYADDMAVWVDGKPVRYASGSFVATGLAAGEHDVRVARGNGTLYSGPMRVYPGLVRRCVPESRALDCVFVETVVSLPPPAPPPPAVVVVRPPEPVRPSVMNDRDFTGFVAAVKGEAFSSDQLGVIQGVARTNSFTIAQVGVVIDQLPHASDKVAAIKVMAPKVVDRENAWKLNEHLTFSSDKDTVRKLFE